MKLLMDSDCLIKLVKSSLKELVCAGYSVEIPSLVRKEVVEDSEGQADATVVRENLKKKLLTEVKSELHSAKGEDAVFSVFQAGKYDAICSDDKRFIKRLRIFQVPYLTPAVLIVLLLKDQKMTARQAFQKLESLSPMISDDEYRTVKEFLHNWREE